MAKRNDNKALSKLLLNCMVQEASMLEMLKLLCNELMEAEVSGQLGAEKSEHTEKRKSHRSGYPPPQTGYQDGHLVPIGAQSKTRRRYPFLCY